MIFDKVNSPSTMMKTRPLVVRIDVDNFIVGNQTGFTDIRQHYYELQSYKYNTTFKYKH